MSDFASTLHADLAEIAGYLPHLAAALIIAVVGFGLAWLFGTIARNVAVRLGLDSFGERRGLQDDLRSVGVRVGLSRALGRAVAATVALATLVQIVDALQLASLAEALRGLLAYVPHLFVAIVILIAAVVIANVLGDAVRTAAARSEIRGEATLGMLVRGLVIVSGVLTALQQIAIDASFIFDVLLVALGGVALALALATGWGARRFFENIAAARYVEENFAPGDTIVSEDIDGVVERVGLTSATLVTTGGERIVVPNAWFATRIVRASKKM